MHMQLVLDEDSYLPIRTAEGFTGDPLQYSSILSKCQNEGAIVQLAVAPADNTWQRVGVALYKM